MYAMTPRWMILPVMLLMTLGCQGKHFKATAIQHEAMNDTLRHRHAHLATMSENAALHDLSLADFHFIPHSSELSGTGVARLDRLALMLDTYGGTVRYETYIQDENFINARLDSVREYLTMTGCSMGRVEIRTALAGGRGMDGHRAVEVYRTGTVKPDEAATGGGFGPSAMGGSR